MQHVKGWFLLLDTEERTINWISWRKGWIYDWVFVHEDAQYVNTLQKSDLWPLRTTNAGLLHDIEQWIIVEFSLIHPNLLSVTIKSL